MKKFVEFFNRKSKKTQIRSNDEFKIELNMPKPVKGVPYGLLIKLKEVLGKLKVDDSFAIDYKYQYAVRKVTKDCYPNYSIRIRSTGQKCRVFRDD